MLQSKPPPSEKGRCIRFNNLTAGIVHHPNPNTRCALCSASTSLSTSPAVL